jgi:cell division protein FtsN
VVLPGFPEFFSQVIQTMAKPSRSSPRSVSKQTGGTFLGIVLGLIVGLAIAVVVALYITRAPTPFVEKITPPAASGTGIIDQQFDPNRALQGKSPGQPVPQTAQIAPPNTAPGQSAAPQQNAPSGMLQEPQIVEVPPTVASMPTNNAAPAPQTQTPANKPPLLANVPPAASANGANAEANAGYFLQVGSYKTASDAEQQRARLAFQGFESKVTQRVAGGATYYRVRIGPFSKFEDMNGTRQRLSEAGIDTSVIRLPKE